MTDQAPERIWVGCDGRDYHPVFLTAEAAKEHGWNDVDGVTAPEYVRADLAPRLAKHQPCGCIICTCESDEQCSGCGAKSCGNHPVGEVPNPVYEPRADLAPKVKPLVWGDHGDGKSCAYLLGLEYEVGYENGSYYWHEHRSDDFGEGFAAEDHAKAAAQADCERRIFSAQEGDRP